MLRTRRKNEYILGRIIFLLVLSVQQMCLLYYIIDIFNDKLICNIKIFNYNNCL